MKIQVTNGDSSKILFTYFCTMYKHLKLILITVISNPVKYYVTLSDATEERACEYISM